MPFFTSTEHAAAETAACTHCPERRRFLETLVAGSVGALVDWPGLAKTKDRHRLV